MYWKPAFLPSIEQIEQAVVLEEERYWYIHTYILDRNRRMATRVISRIKQVTYLL